MTDELKPCPFCGGEASSRHLPDTYADGYHEHFIQCNDCKVSSARFMAHKDDAFGAHQRTIEAWNHRTPSEAEAKLENK